jgi:hypothetical protein
MQPSHGLEGIVAGQRDPPGVKKIPQQGLEGLRREALATSGSQAFVGDNLQHLGFLVSPGLHQHESPSYERCSMFIGNDVGAFLTADIAIAEGSSPRESPCIHCLARSIPHLLGEGVGEILIKRTEKIRCHRARCSLVNVALIRRAEEYADAPQFGDRLGLIPVVAGEPTEILYDNISYLPAVRSAVGKHSLELRSICRAGGFTRIDEHLDDMPTLPLAILTATLLLVVEVQWAVGLIIR